MSVKITLFANIPDIAGRLLAHRVECTLQKLQEGIKFNGFVPTYLSECPTDFHFFYFSTFIFPIFFIDFGKCFVLLKLRM